MATLDFDASAFRAQFPAYADSAAYPDVTLQAYWSAAILHISNEDYGWLQGAARQRALYLMLAHLAFLSALASKGEIPAILQSATIDKVTITVAQVPVKDQWQWWLSTSPYGAELLALLSVAGAGGFYVGGLPEGAAFRKVAGIY